MNRIKSTPSSKKKNIRIVFLIICSLFILENGSYAWNKESMQFHYNDKKDAILINFLFYDYNYNGQRFNAHLQNCTFEYSTDGDNYFHLLNASSDYQTSTDKRTWINMTDKAPNAVIYTKMLPREGVPLHYIKLEENTKQKFYLYSDNIYTKIWLNLIWKMDANYHGITNIRVRGSWNIMGKLGKQVFSEAYSISPPKKNTLKANHLNTSPSHSKTGVNITVSKNNEIKVCKDAEAIIIKGAECGKNIDVYTTSGVLMNSSVASDEVIKIKLPVNQIYHVNIGKASYKIAL